MNFIQNLIDTYNKGQLYDECHAELVTTQEMLGSMQEDLLVALDKIDDLEDTNEELEIFIEDLEDDIKVIADNALKEYFYNKYPKQKSFTWNGMRVKNFCTTTAELPVITGATHDDVANNCLKWVNNYMTYTAEQGDNWQTVEESLERKKGDCEDGAILMYNLMRTNGVPEWRIRLNCGMVQGGGHAYITYLREKDNKWYILDWCYWYTESVSFRKTWSEAKKYFEVWFSWNSDYVWVEPDKI